MNRRDLFTKRPGQDALSDNDNRQVEKDGELLKQMLQDARFPRDAGQAPQQEPVARPRKRRKSINSRMRSLVRFFTLLIQAIIFGFLLYVTIRVVLFLTRLL